MTIPPTEAAGVGLDQLETQLSALPGAKLLQLVSLLEASLDKSREPATVLALLSKLRGRMRELRPPRRRSLRRLICQPFEDLLLSTKSQIPTSGKIPRSAIGPIWKLMSDEGGPLFQALATEYATMPANSEQMPALQERIWAFGSETLRSVLAQAEQDVKRKRALVPQLGGEHVYDALSTIGDVLDIAGSVEKLKAMLPDKPIREITNDTIKQFKALVDDVGRVTARRSMTLIHVLIGRLEKPADIVQILQRMAVYSDGKVDPRLQSAVLQTLVDGTQGQFESMRDGMEEKNDAPSTEKLAEQVTQCMRDLEEAKEALKSGERTGQLDRQLERTRRSIREVVELKILEGADEEILSSVLDADGAVGATMGGDDLPFHRGPDEAKQIAAEQRAIALRLCQEYAAELGIGDQVQNRLDKIQAGVEARANSIINDLMAGPVPPAQRAAYEANLYASVRMLELLVGPDHADEIRKTGIEALNSFE
jgi:hypothetical protein